MSTSFLRQNKNSHAVTNRKTHVLCKCSSYHYCKTQSKESTKKQRKHKTKKITGSQKARKKKLGTDRQQLCCPGAPVHCGTALWPAPCLFRGGPAGRGGEEVPGALMAEDRVTESTKES